MGSHVGTVQPIRAVLFDIGGVFFPWPQADFFNRWEQQLGMPNGSISQRLWYGPDIEAANRGIISAEEYYRRCAMRNGVDETQIGTLVERAFGGEPRNEKLVAYVRTLHSRVRVAAITNTWSFGRTLLQRQSIAELFDVFVSSAEEGVTKPHPRLFEIALERLDLPPDQVAFVDDTMENVAVARSLGIASIQFVSAEQTIRELENLLAQPEGAG